MYRGLKYGDDADAIIGCVLWANVRLHPTYNLAQYTNLLNRLMPGANISREFVRRIFVSWGWTWKQPSTQQLRKYTAENMQYYRRWIFALPLHPLHKLKFCDEAHFTTRHLRRGRQVGPSGARLYTTSAEGLNTDYSLTLLLDLTNNANPFFLHLRAGSNSEWDFFEFVVAAVEEGRLVEGDWLIVDNASVHFGQETWEPLTTLLSAAGVRYLFLPTYSPELNPCELIFANVKNYIRNNQFPHFRTYELMLLAFANIPFAHVWHAYEHCVFIKDRM